MYPVYTLLRISAFCRDAVHRDRAVDAPAQHLLPRSSDERSRNELFTSTLEASKKFHRILDELAFEKSPMMFGALQVHQPARRGHVDDHARAVPMCRFNCPSDWTLAAEMLNTATS